MKTRRLGRTNHQSSLSIFGAAALADVSQPTADRSLVQVINAGVNHIDVAPSYGDAEERLRPWLARERERFFLGCKTHERKKEGAAEGLRRSLARLGVDSFDLFQLHGIDTAEKLDLVTGPGGALEAIVEAREEGLVDYIGITGHGLIVADLFLEALERFDFDTVLFPVSFVLYANPEYRRSAEALLQRCQERDVGVMAIKAVAKALWHERPRTHKSWYEPMDRFEEVEPTVHWSLSQPVTGLCTVGDIRVLPLFLRACGSFEAPLSAEEQEAMVGSAGRYEPIFSEAHPTL